MGKLLSLSVAVLLAGCTSTGQVPVDAAKVDVALADTGGSIAGGAGGGGGVVATGGATAKGTGGSSGAGGSSDNRVTGGSGGGTATGTAAGGASTSTKRTGGAGGGRTASGGAGGTSSSAGTTGTQTGSGGARDGGMDGTTSSIIDQLKQYLAVPRAQRKPIDGEPFAKAAISQDEATQAADLLWQDFAANIKATRKAEHDARAITLEGKTMRYTIKTFGTKPAQGRSLFLSLHGGGNADPSVNDEQWTNQQTLYQPDEGIYLCPRAPTDTWNLWHEAHIDPMFERLITNLIVLESVNPDRVYVMGYSAGGDGVYQLGPRMADHWAAAAAMAGHPNEAQPLSLRNIGFTIHVGALDTSYDRNLVAQQWGDELDRLEAADPGGYPHVVQIHAGKSHWMDLEDAVAVPWMAKFTRTPMPAKIVWYQDDIVHTRFYWLAVATSDAKAKAEVRATLAGATIALESKNVASIEVRLSDSMVDLDQPVVITTNGNERWTGTVTRTIAVLARTLEERGDPRLVFAAEVPVTF